MTPIESKWAELVAEIATQEKRLVPQWGKIKAVALELLGTMVKTVADLEARIEQLDTAPTCTAAQFNSPPEKKNDATD